MASDHPRSSRRRLPPRLRHAGMLAAPAGPDVTSDPPTILDPPPPATVPKSVRQTDRVRRPTGSPAPLPRSLGFTGRTWLVGLVLLLAWVVACALFRDARRVTDQFDAAVLRFVAGFRTAWLSEALTEIDAWFSGWTVTVVGIGLLLALVVFKRWRHLFTFLGGVALVELVSGDILYNGFTRPRPYDVATIGRWAGFSLPSPPVVVVTMLLLGIVYGLTVPGPARRMAKWAAAGLIGVFAFARLYLAVDHPFDIVLAVALCMGILVNAFRFFTPNEAFPVTYRRGKTAHLDISGRRGEAVKVAVSAQLGLIVKDIKPVGLAGSGGSTPLRLTVAGDPDEYLFAKLYSMTHVRADRWYKLGRTLLYGRLEDERPFGSVRRLVEYEDYTARVVHDVGIPTAATFGIVELTPEREYLLVTEFLDGAVEITEATVDDSIVDSGLMVVRRLWDAGLAHRDIKPANLMVHDGEVKLIDVAFVQVRPSPWRQAIDLANMMLVLAVGTDAKRVYDRALRALHPRGDRRGVRRHEGHRQPLSVAGGDEAGRPRPGGRVPLDGAGPPAHSAPALGGQTVRPGRRPDHRGGAGARGDREHVPARPRRRGVGGTPLRHQQRDDPDGSVGAVGDPDPLRRRTSRRLGLRSDARQRRAGIVLARLRSGRRQGTDRHPAAPRAVLGGRSHRGAQ